MVAQVPELKKLKPLQSNGFNFLWRGCYDAFHSPLDLANLKIMEAFNATPPDWSEKAVHAQGFCCHKCGQPPSQAKAVWINRRSPVYTENHQRKWQEFYHCECEAAWWAWSSDRPPSEFRDRVIRPNNNDFL